MSKTEKPIDEFAGVSRRKLIADLKVARSEATRANEKLAGARDDYNKAWTVANDWKERCQKVEKDNKVLERERDGLKQAVEVLAGQVNRCIGFISAKLEEHPAPEAKPEATKNTDRDYENWRHNEAVMRSYSGEGQPEPVKHWRRFLGLEEFRF